MIKTLGRTFHFVLYTEAVEIIQNNLPVYPLLEVTASSVVPKIIEHITLFYFISYYKHQIIFFIFKVLSWSVFSQQLLSLLP